MDFQLPEHCKIVNIGKPSAANGLTCDYVSCKDAEKVWFLIQHAGASDTDLTLTLNESTAVGGTTAAVTATCPIWQNVTVGTTNDALARVATDACVVTIDTTTNKNQLAVIEWDPAKHTAGYDCISLAESGGDGSNFVAVTAIIQSRLPHAGGPPSAIVD